MIYLKIAILKELFMNMKKDNKYIDEFIERCKNTDINVIKEALYIVMDACDEETINHLYEHCNTNDIDKICEVLHKGI